MKRTVLLLAALAALAGLASASVYPTQGGYDCSGRISHVACFVDEHGIVTGVVYENDLASTPVGFCKTGGVIPEGASLDLDPNENIVSVTACRGGRYGYSSVVFQTDAGRNLTCGGRDSGDYAPPGYDTYAGTYESGDYVQGYKGRIQKGHYAKKPKAGRGWGDWSSKCQTYASPKQPVWASKKADWYKKGYSSKDWGYASNNYGRAWDMYNAYFKYSPAAPGGHGKESRYFKDYDTYKKVAKDYGHKPSSYKYQPDYYYAQLYPLSAFKVACDYFGNVYNVYKFCWNKAYMPPPPLDVLPVTIAIELPAGSKAPVTCPPSPELNTELTGIINATADALLASNYTAALISGVTLEPNASSCVPETTEANATITYVGALIPAKGVDLQQLIAGLAPVLPTGSDLCTFPGVDGACEAFFDVTHIIISYDTNVRSQQYQLSRRVVRNRLKKFTKLHTKQH